MLSGSHTDVMGFAWAAAQHNIQVLLQESGGGGTLGKAMVRSCLPVSYLPPRTSCSNGTYSDLLRTYAPCRLVALVLACA